jgi:hypothetical protein
MVPFTALTRLPLAPMLAARRERALGACPQALSPPAPPA